MIHFIIRLLLLGPGVAMSEVVYMISRFCLLTVESHDLSQAKKKNTVVANLQTKA